jgi:pyruvate dehydrogenase E1 component alpha subunit
VREAGVEQDFFDSLDAEAEALAVRIREACRTLEDPSPLSPFDYVFVESTSELAEQRAGYAEYLDSFEEAHR